MGCEVYANGDEIACKAGDGKVIAAFPDVCLTPPTPPAGPIPVPYPNTSFSKDMQSGSKTVQIKGKEVMLKDQSFYKTSPLGDEAATNGQGAGVVTHVITGKTFFMMWSMDVQFEGKNVDRHTDMTTSNHACPPANASVPMLNAAKPAPPADSELKQKCGESRAKIADKNAKLGKELRKYDPVSDAKGGFPSHHDRSKLTVPGGHYKKARDLQRGLRNELEEFDKNCRGSGVKIHKSVNANANREIEPPPGFPRIKL